jgi:flagellar hook-associated protein 2
MATISSPGIGSGLDVSSIITQLMAIERQPIKQLETAETKLQSQISEMGKIKSALSKFRDLSTRLGATDFWRQSTGSSTSTAVGVTTGSGAMPGSYSVEVQGLASAQSISTGVFASSTTALNAGTLRIEMGTWNAGKTLLAPNATLPAVDITIEATDTLASVRDKINAAGGGVTASILNDAGGARLLMRSTSTGEANGFRTTVTGGGALDGLAYDPSAGINSPNPVQDAANAAATINGVPVSSATNSMANVLDGVSLNLTAETVSPVIVSVVNDTAAMKKTMEEFATAYSDLARQIAADTRYDAASKKAGLLQGDSAITGLQSRLRSMIGATSGASTAFPRLSDAGFELQQDGTLKVNSSRLDNALANLPQLRLMFANSSTTDPTMDGFAKRFRTVAGDALGTDGVLTTRTDGLNERLTRNQKNQDRLEERLVQTQKRLERQYTQLDTQLGTLNGLSSFVTQQVAQWSKSS